MTQLSRPYRPWWLIGFALIVGLIVSLAASAVVPAHRRVRELETELSDVRQSHGAFQRQMSEAGQRAEALERQLKILATDRETQARAVKQLEQELGQVKRELAAEIAQRRRALNATDDARPRAPASSGREPRAGAR